MSLDVDVLATFVVKLLVAYTAAFKQWPCCMLHHKWEGVQMTQQREEREKTNHPKQLSCTVQPQGEGLEGAQGHLEQAQS